MEKQADFKPGITKCAFCNEIATVYLKNTLYCEKCASKRKYKIIPEEK